MKVFGIPIKAHWSLPAYIALFIVAYFCRLLDENITFAHLIFTIFVSYFSVLGHELSHSLMAKRYGYNTRAIIINMFGGLALIEAYRFKPKENVAISFAGPLFNIAVSVAFLIPLFFTYNLSYKYFILIIIVANFMMGIFNLIPIYPMDGGRILRALLYNKSEVLAMNISHAISLFFILILLAVGFSFNIPLFLIVSIFSLIIIAKERINKKNA